MSRTIRKAGPGSLHSWKQTLRGRDKPGMMLSLNRRFCLNLEQSLQCEWLETNGMGGFSSSTILDCHTRKYHGVLSANLDEPKGRFLLCSKLELEVEVDGKTFLLSTNKYPDVFHPTGHQYVDSFEYQTHPVIRYRLGDLVLTKSMLMRHGENTVMLHLAAGSSKESVMLRLKPLLAYRSIHDLTRENMYLQVKCYPVRDGWKMEPYQGMPPIYFRANRACKFYPGPHWFCKVEYLKERNRGYDYQEDLFCPGVFEASAIAQPSEGFLFAVSLAPLERPLDRLWKQELHRRRRLLTVGRSDDAMFDMLKLHAEKFLVTRPSGGKSVVAGYHWFDEWGRDTLIALPGLTVYAGRPRMALQVLKHVASMEREGLVPNVLLDDGTPLYNSVDAGLWFFWAAQIYAYQTGDFDAVFRHLWKPFRRIVMAHLEGRIPYTRMEAHGLLWTGDASTQLTWMDARVGGVPVTPRHGMAVDVNALWINALSFLIELSERFTQVLDPNLSRIRDTASKNFAGVFMLRDGYLADCINENGVDRSLRPNQLFAVSLPSGPKISLKRQRSIVSRVRKELLTPFGLRTLSPADVRYHPYYQGSQEQRDRAYHQGTVWPWLIGHFVEAALKTAHDPAKRARQLRGYFAPLFRKHPLERGLFCMSEIFEGNPPHQAKGCIAQAWSVAEVIRAMCLIRDHIQ